MGINWQEFLTTLGSGGIVLFAAAWLVRALVVNRLTRDVEGFKAQLKSSADLEIERARAFFARASRVHERQLDIL